MRGKQVMTRTASPVYLPQLDRKTRGQELAGGRVQFRLTPQNCKVTPSRSIDPGRGVSFLVSRCESHISLSSGSETGRFCAASSTRVSSRRNPFAG